MGASKMRLKPLSMSGYGRPGCYQGYLSLGISSTEDRYPNIYSGLLFAQHRTEPSASIFVLISCWQGLACEVLVLAMTGDFSLKDLNLASRESRDIKHICHSSRFQFIIARFLFKFYAAAWWVTETTWLLTVPVRLLSYLHMQLCSPFQSLFFWESV